MTSPVDLTKVSSEDLRAELSRRQQAAKAKGKPLKYATKAEWAEAQAASYCERIAAAEATYAEGHVGLRKKNDHLRALQDQLDKFRRLAASYRKKGL